MKLPSIPPVIFLFVLVPLFRSQSQTVQETGLHDISPQTIEARIDSLKQLRTKLQDEIKEVETSIRRLEKFEIKTKLTERSDNKVVRGTVFKSVFLRPKPGQDWDSETQIPALSKVILVDYLDTEKLFKVNYNGEIGFIPAVDVRKTREVREFQAAHSERFIPAWEKREKERRAEEEKIRQKEERRKERSRLYEKLKAKEKIITSNKAWVKVRKANARSMPSKNAAIIGHLEKGDRIYVQGKQGDWLSVMYSDPLNVESRFDSEDDFNKSFITAWVHTTLVTKTELPRLTTAQKRREKYVASHPNGIEPTVRNAILGGSVVLGMTKDMVIASWGHPVDVNRTVGAFGVHEQWVYRRRGASRKYLYFENGKLTSWQD